MNEKEIIREIKRLYGEDKKVYLQELLHLKDGWASWDKLTIELKKITGQPTEGHCELIDDVIEWILSEKTNEKRKFPNFEFQHTPSYHYRIVLTEGIRHPLDWGKRLASNCGGSVHFCDLRICMILPLYTLDTFFLNYSRKDNWMEDGSLKVLSDFEKSVLNNINKSMKIKGFSYVNKKTALKRIRSAFTDIKSEGNASVYECLFSDLYEYFGCRTRFSDKEIDDATTGAKVRWFEYYDSNHNLKKKSLISDFPSGDVTKTIFNGKGEIKKIIILPKDILKEFEIDVDKRIKQTKRK